MDSGLNGFTNSSREVYRHHYLSHALYFPSTVLDPDFNFYIKFSIKNRSNSKGYLNLTTDANCKTRGNENVNA